MAAFAPAPSCPHSHYHPSPLRMKFASLSPSSPFLSLSPSSLLVTDFSFLPAYSFLLSTFILLLSRHVSIFLVSGVLQIWLLLAGISHSIIHCPAWSLCCSGPSHNYTQVCLWTCFGFPWYFHAPGRPCPLLHWSKESFGCPVVSCESFTIHCKHTYILLHNTWQQVILGHPWKTSDDLEEICGFIIFFSLSLPSFPPASKL